MKDFLHSRFLSPLIIILFILFANSLYLTGIFNQNPINRQSGLSVQSSRLLGGLNTIDPNDGFITQALGHEAAESLLHGHLAWWNYDEQVGAPLAGEMQSAALFPLTPLLALGTGVLYFHIVLEAIAGLATYYLLKKLKCSDIAALIGGLLFAINGTFAWFGAANINPIAFMPLLLLGIEIAYNKAIQRQRRGWLLITLALALSLYAGFPEAAYLDAVFAGCWIVTRLFYLRHGNWKQFLAKILTGIGVGFLIAAPILMAFYDYLQVGYVGSHSGAAIKGLSLPTASLPALVFPYLYGPIFAATRFNSSGIITTWWSNVGGYVTLPLVLFSLIGLAVKGHKYLKVFLAGWIIVIIARVYGFPDLWRVLDLIPGMSSVAVYRYVQPTFELAMVILSAFGLDYLLRDKKLSKHQTISIVGVLSLIILVAVIIALESRKLVITAPHYWAPMFGSIAWGIASVLIIAISIRSSFKYKKIIYSVVLVSDALLMFIIPNVSAFHSARIDTAPINFLQNNLGDSRFYSMGPIAANYSSFYGIASIDTNNIPLPATWASYVTKDLNTNTNPFIFSGTFSANPTGLSNEQAFFKYINNYRYLGIKYVVVSPKSISISEAQTNSLKEVFSDKVADIYELNNPQPYFQILNGDCQTATINKSSVAIDCVKSGLLLRRELYMPGWNAVMNNKRLQVKQNGPLFQSVILPKGKYVLNFNFLPPHMFEAVGLMITGFVIVIWIYFSNIRKFIARSVYKFIQWFYK